MFFVLSGHLITSLLLLEKERTGGIDLRAFWFRRARRLLPAVLLMLVFVELWVAVTAPPFELAWRRRDILWTLFYGANWHFIASDQGYFAQFTSASPLRHAWSLAIEEQFYLVWPVLIMAAVVFSRRSPAGGRHRLQRRHRRLGRGIDLALRARRSVTQLLRHRHPDASAPGWRAARRVERSPDAAQDRCRWLARRSARGRRPRGRVLPARRPQLGVLLRPLRRTGGLRGGADWGLETAPAGVFARALSWGPVRWTGRISYGLYLWHWPVILAIVSAPVVLRELPGSSGVNVTRLLVTFGVAAVSFYGMEQPLRRGRVSWVRSSVPRLAAAVAIAVAAVVGAAVWATPTPPDSAGRVEIAGCPADGDTPCLRRKGSPGGPVVALIGDSIARSLDPAFTQLAGERGWTVRASGGERLPHLEAPHELRRPCPPDGQELPADDAAPPRAPARYVEPDHDHRDRSVGNHGRGRSGRTCDLERNARAHLAGRTIACRRRAAAHVAGRASRVHRTAAHPSPRLRVGGSAVVAAVSSRRPRRRRSGAVQRCAAPRRANCSRRVHDFDHRGALSGWASAGGISTAWCCGSMDCISRWTRAAGSSPRSGSS